MSPEDLRERCRITDDGHWLWAGAVSDGYPRVWAPDFTRREGGMCTQTGWRAMWHVKTAKPIPNGWRVFRTCNERTCINPEHLVCRPVAAQGALVAKSGKLKNNIRRITANRASGRKRSALTPEQIVYVRASAKTGLELAAEFGVSHQTISKHRSGQRTAFAPVGGIFSGLLAANDQRRRSA
jgi:hypothetical protein